MTTITISFTRMDGPIFFDVEGHTGYQNPETGNNDVCVAVSAICSGLVEHLRKEHGLLPDICKDGHIRYDIEASALRIREAFKMAENSLKWLQSQHPDYIKIY